MDKDMELIQDGEQLAAFAAETFPMTPEEAGVLLGYIAGHGYALAGKDGRLYRGGVCGQPEKICWEEYDIEDVVDDATEWNFAMMQNSERLMDQLESYYDYQQVSENTGRCVTMKKYWTACLTAQSTGRSLKIWHPG
ncbi:MAG TPA: hypothetical protein DCZ91_06490, partial [Lachnospiraceae bacterium]|nr:hypothetical protein [Lachnospiraceae bacterium]